MRRLLELILLLLAASAFAYAPQRALFSQFDGANRLINTITPMSRSTQQVYNNRGLLQSVTEPSTQTVTFGYDGKGRLTNRVDQVGTTTYQYDPNNNLTNVLENGKTNSWTFDAYDRVSSYRDPDGNLVQYRFDANGNVTNLVYPGNRTVNYLYDSLNRLTNVTDWASRKTTLAYDLDNHLTSITRPNGTVRTINYDATGQTTNIVEQLTGGAPIAFFRLNWDNAARVQWEFATPLPQTNTTPPTRTITYNDDNQIATFKGPTMGSAVAVGYDTDGNLTSGPLTNDTFVTYGYNARNQLTSAGGITYAYDPAGNRVAMTNGASVTRFVVNPNAKLSQVLMRVRSGVTNYYIYGPGLLYEITETATTTNTLTYHYDLRGSTIAITDNNGNVTDRVQYSAYGMITLRGGTNDTPFLYNGRYGVMTDSNGLLYMRARYYNPYLCRFINSDPAGFGGGLNWYCSADGNPISMIDPFGLHAVGEGGGGSYWLGVGQVFAGYGDAAWGLAKGTANAIINADDTFEAIGNAIASPVQTGQAIWNGVGNTLNNLGSTDSRVQGQAMGNILITAGMAAAPFADGLAAAETGMSLASGAGGEVLPMTVVKTLPPGTAGGILNEAKALTFSTGNEHALVRLATGERALVSGGPGGISFAEGEVTRIVGHTHPYGSVFGGPSAADSAALRALGQTHSYVVEGGQIFRFGP